MIMDRLYKLSKERGPLCVGLDTRTDYFPDYLSNEKIGLEEKLFTFNKKIIDETIDLAACYKVQIACYEAYGLEGLKAYSRTLKYIRENDAVVIADIKRGDISSTGEMYAKGHFEGDFEADLITLNPYMGVDSISPYYEYMKKGKGAFVLLKTSNESSKDFQDIKDAKDTDMYINVAKKIDEWGSGFVGESGYSMIGAVVGLTNPEDFGKIKKASPNTFYLIPGYGAQGGSAEEIRELFKDDICGVINSSRGIIKAHKGKCETEDFAKEARKALIEMKEDILSCLR